MKRRIVAVMLGALAAFTGMPANAGEPLLRVTCPSTWPGPDHRGARLSYSKPWFDSLTTFGEWDTLIHPPYERSTLLDCAYGGAASGSRFQGGVFSDLRLTVRVPGRARRCNDRGAGNSWCDTALEADGTIGPIRIYIAERPTLATTLLGFGLRQSEGDIRTIADAGGFACTEEPGTGTLQCTRQHDRIDIGFKDGRSAAIRWLLPRDKPGQGGWYDRMVYRFGFRRDFVFGSTGRFDVWQEPDSPVRVTLAAEQDPMVLTLEDTAGQTKPEGRQ